MARFSPDRFPPGFFDLPQTAGETLPLDVIAAWTVSDHTPDAARAIVAPYALHGFVVSTDSAGLTRLTRERPLLEILALINHPKELVHAHGRAVGGRALGVWAADNTQMFYPDEVGADQLLAMLVTTTRRIAAECELRIGIAAHSGVFYELGGGVYGPDADRVEILAEERAGAGELLVTDSVLGALSGTMSFVTTPREDLRDDFGVVHRVLDGPVLEALTAFDTAYPAPYSSDFTTGLAEYSRTRRESRAPNTAYQDLVVVMIECEPEEPDVPEVVVLNDLALTAAMKRIGRSLLVDHAGTDVKTAGRLGIYTFADASVAVRFAQSFRAEFAAQGVACRAGVDAGKVLLFDLGPGSREIAGSPVNVASKLAQDVGAYGTIRVTDVVLARSAAKPARPTLSLSVSGLELRTHDL
jgi:hypothetical protein